MLNKYILKTLFPNLLSVLVILKKYWNKIDSYIFDRFFLLESNQIKNFEQSIPIVYIKEDNNFKLWFNNERGWPSKYSFFTNRELNLFNININPFKKESGDLLIIQIQNVLNKCNLIWDENNPIILVTAGICMPLVLKTLTENYKKKSLFLKKFHTLVFLEGNVKGIKFYDYILKNKHGKFNNVIRSLISLYFGMKPKYNKNIDTFLKINSCQYCNKISSDFLKILKNNPTVRRIYIVKNDMTILSFFNKFHIYIPKLLIYNPINIIFNIIISLYYTFEKGTQRQCYRKYDDGITSLGIRSENQILEDADGIIYSKKSSICNLFEKWYMEMELLKLLRDKKIK